MAIIQSSYIPWKGFFDLIQSVDECIIYDDVQFTKRDWRSRNMIKTPNGLLWLSIPIKTKGKYSQNVDQAEVLDHKWCARHWNAINHSYSKAAHFGKFKKELKQAYLELEAMNYLSEVNVYLIKKICAFLNITSEISFSKDYGYNYLNKTDRLVAICKATSATHYLSGPTAKAYIEPNKFSEQNIELSYIDYSQYLTYPQIHGDFTHFVSIIDLLANVGFEASKYLTTRA